MNLLLEAFAWLADPASWSGPNGLGAQLAGHLVLSLAVVVASTLIGVPLGLLIGHTGRGRELAVLATGGLRALPTLGVLTLFALWLGIGVQAPFFALLIFAIPSTLAGAYSGVEAVDRATVGAARSIGMTELQIVTRVELPLALPTIIGGIRATVLQVVATATLAAYVGASSLGSPVFLGLKTRDYGMMLGGSLLVIVLALVLDGLFAVVQRLVVPAGVRASRSREHRDGRPARAAVG